MQGLRHQKTSLTDDLRWVGDHSSCVDAENYLLTERFQSETEKTMFHQLLAWFKAEEKMLTVDDVTGQNLIHTFISKIDYFNTTVEPLRETAGETGKQLSQQRLAQVMDYAERFFIMYLQKTYRI